MIVSELIGRLLELPPEMLVEVRGKQIYKDGDHGLPVAEILASLLLSMDAGDSDTEFSVIGRRMILGVEDRRRSDETLSWKF